MKSWRRRIGNWWRWCVKGHSLRQQARLRMLGYLRRLDADRSGVIQEALDQAPAVLRNARTDGDAAHVAEAVRAGARRINGANCLVQALACKAMLKDRGIDSQLIIGVARRDGQLGAHAWLRCDGRIILGELNEIDDFKVLTSPSWTPVCVKGNNNE